MIIYLIIVENHAWGLNFVSEEEAQKFLDFCCVCDILSTTYVSFWSLNTVRTYVLGSGNKLSRVSDDLIKVYSNVPTTSDKLNALVLNIHHRLDVCVQCPIHHRQLPHHPVIQSQVCVTMRPRYGLELQALFSWLCDKC